MKCSQPVVTFSTNLHNLRLLHRLQWRQNLLPKIEQRKDHLIIRLCMNKQIICQDKRPAQFVHTD